MLKLGRQRIPLRNVESASDRAIAQLPLVLEYLWRIKRPLYQFMQRSNFAGRAAATLTSFVLKRASATKYRRVAAAFGMPIKRPLQHFHPKRASLPGVGLHQLQNALVFAGEWIIISGENAYFENVVHLPGKPVFGKQISAYSSLNGSLLVAEQSESTFDDPSFLLGGVTNYAHWLYDCLPKLRFYDKGKGWPIVTNADLTRFQTESLRYLDIDPAGLLLLDFPAAYKFSKLLVPHLGRSLARRGGLSIETLDWLRSKFRSVLSTTAPHRKLFISRASAHRLARRLINYDEVEDFLQRNGFEIIEPSHLTFMEQVKVFSEAKIIVGPHGAGLANAIFASRECMLVELMGPKFNLDYSANMFFNQVAQLRGQPYLRVVGETSGSRPDSPVNESYCIRPEALRSIL